MSLRRRCALWSAENFFHWFYLEAFANSVVNCKRVAAMATVCFANVPPLKMRGGIWPGSRRMKQNQQYCVYLWFNWPYFVLQQCAIRTMRRTTTMTMLVNNSRLTRVGFSFSKDFLILQLKLVYVACVVLLLLLHFPWCNGVGCWRNTPFVAQWQLAHTAVSYALLCRRVLRTFAQWS